MVVLALEILSTALYIGTIAMTFLYLEIWGVGMACHGVEHPDADVYCLPFLNYL